MKNVFQDTSANGWILIPAGNLVEFVAQEQKICGTTIRGYVSLQMLPSLVTTLKHHLPGSAHQLRSSLSALEEGAPSDAALAKEEIEAEFTTIFAHHTIAVWAAVETTLEQIVVSFILRSPESRELILSSLPEAKIGTITTNTLKEAKRTARRWQAVLENPSELGRALEVLSTLGFHVIIRQSTTQDLDEMSAIRNLILHRGGFVDDEFQKKCPWIAAATNVRLQINKSMMDRYFSAASEFAVALIGAVAKSPHIRVDAKA